MEHSERICKPCGRSLRRTHAIYQQLKSAFLKEANQTTKVKVVVLNPNQATETKSNFSEESKLLILNISRKKWQTTANAVFKHPELKDKLLKHLQGVIEKEFSNYCKDSTKSILLGKSPKEVAEFRSRKLLKELQISCPYWSAAIMGASGMYNTADDANAVKSNVLALASAVVARARNHKMSALAYRMSTILFHGGAKSEYISRMNKLGVCMLPKSTVEFQHKMGENCQCKVLKWKSMIENNKMALLFLEVQRRHAVHETSDATTVVDFTNN